jgi:hypothetical protein
MKVKGHYPLNNVEFNFNSSRNKMRIETHVPSNPCSLTINARKKIDIQLTQPNQSATNTHNKTTPQPTTPVMHRGKYTKLQKSSSKICVKDLLVAYSTTEYHTNNSSNIAMPTKREIATADEAITDLINFINSYKSEQIYHRAIDIAQGIKKALKRASNVK